MLRRLLLCAIIFPPLILSVGCSGESADAEAQAKALATAEEFFAACSAPGPKAREVLKLSEFTVFGREWLLESPLAAGSASATLVAETSPRTYEVVIPFWCNGTDLGGKAVKLSRELRLKVRGGEVQSYELRDEELTLTRQIKHMAVVALGAPLIAFMIIFFCIPIFSDILMALSSHLPNKLLAILFGPVTVGVVAYSAYVCFGSVVVAAISGAAYALIGTWLVWGWLEMRKEMRWRSRYNY
ncbi:MAG TPA: hypothetical protein VE713_15465 [Pyrinomonadaceae bacterium]|nr:hypothetical protein [Pyrinomonadaceae bacterium]